MCLLSTVTISATSTLPHVTLDGDNTPIDRAQLHIQLCARTCSAVGENVITADEIDTTFGNTFTTTSEWYTHLNDALGETIKASVTENNKHTYQCTITPEPSADVDYDAEYDLFITTAADSRSKPNVMRNDHVVRITGNQQASISGVLTGDSINQIRIVTWRLAIYKLTYHGTTPVADQNEWETRPVKVNCTLSKNTSATGKIDVKTKLYNVRRKVMTLTKVLTGPDLDRDGNIYLPESRQSSFKLTIRTLPSTDMRPIPRVTATTATHQTDEHGHVLTIKTDETNARHEYNANFSITTDEVLGVGTHNWSIPVTLSFD